MLTNLLRGKTKESKPASDAPMGSSGLAIGDADAHVFNCPSCSRPLSEGTSRCPGCGARLIMGVLLKRAGAILALGFVSGILIGGLVTAAAITLSLRDPAVVAVIPSASPAPTTSPAPTAAASIPVQSGPAVTALSGTAVVNGRIAVDMATLQAKLSNSNVSTIELARALRSLAADAALGTDLVDRLAPWREATTVKGQLDGFYTTIASKAHQALQASLSDTAGYRRAGAEMLTVLGGLGEVDAASRVLAATVDLELPPVAIPGALSAPSASPSPSPSASATP